MPPHCGQEAPEPKLSPNHELAAGCRDLGLLGAPAGLALVVMLMVTESWLNAVAGRAPTGQRGRPGDTARLHAASSFTRYRLAISHANDLADRVRLLATSTVTITGEGGAHRAESDRSASDSSA